MTKKVRTKLEIVGDDYVIEQLKNHIMNMCWRVDYLKKSILFVEDNND